MDTIYVTQDCVLSRDENTILVKTDKNKIRVPVESVRHIICMSDGNISTKLLSLCGKSGIRISFFDYYGWFVGAFEPIEASKSGLVTLKQAGLIGEVRGLNLAKQLIIGTIKNHIANLKYHQYRGNAGLATTISVLNAQVDNVQNSQNRSEIMGNEGYAKRAYFESWKLVDPKLDFGVRKKRPPNNMINCMISFINSLVYSNVRHEIAKTHLNETLSFLHAPSQSRSSLSLDLSEPFKPLITDAIIWKLIRKNEIDSGWFEYPSQGVCLLNPVGKKNIIAEFGNLFEGDGGYRKLIRQLALDVERVALGAQDDIRVHVRRV